MKLAWCTLAGLVLSQVGVAQDSRRTLAKTDGSTVVCVTWNNRTFTYHSAIEGSSRITGDAEFAAIDAAFASWQALSNTCSDFTFVSGPRVTSPSSGKGSERQNVVVFRESACAQVVPQSDPCLSDGSCSAVYGCWSHSSTTIGLTSVTYSTRTGIAVDADIELNGADFVFTTVASPPCAQGSALANCVAYDVQNTMTHEIGHVVGFDHVASPSSTMAPTAPMGETSKRIIDLGTADGFCSTYPRGQPPTPCDEQLKRRVVANTAGTVACSASGGGAAVLLWATVFLVAAAPRRRRLTRMGARLQR